MPNIRFPSLARYALGRPMREKPASGRNLVHCADHPKYIGSDPFVRADALILICSPDGWCLCCPAVHP